MTDDRQPEHRPAKQHVRALAGPLDILDHIRPAGRLEQPSRRLDELRQRQQPAGIVEISSRRSRLTRRRRPHQVKLGQPTRIEIQDIRLNAAPRIFRLRRHIHARHLEPGRDQANRSAPTAAKQIDRSQVRTMLPELIGGQNFHPAAIEPYRWIFSVRRRSAASFNSVTHAGNTPTGVMYGRHDEQASGNDTSQPSVGHVSSRINRPIVEILQWAPIGGAPAPVGDMAHPQRAGPIETRGDLAQELLRRRTTEIRLSHRRALSLDERTCGRAGDLFADPFATP